MLKAGNSWMLTVQQSIIIWPAGLTRITLLKKIFASLRWSETSFLSCAHQNTRQPCTTVTAKPYQFEHLIVLTKKIHLTLKYLFSDLTYFYYSHPLPRDGWLFLNTKLKRIIYRVVFRSIIVRGSNLHQKRSFLGAYYLLRSLQKWNCAILPPPSSFSIILSTELSSKVSLEASLASQAYSQEHHLQSYIQTSSNSSHHPLLGLRICLITVIVSEKTTGKINSVHVTLAFFVKIKLLLIYFIVRL